LALDEAGARRSAPHQIAHFPLPPASTKLVTPSAPRPRPKPAAWAQFTQWCAANDHVALPAAPETIAAWIVNLADGAEERRPLSRSTINLYLSAVMQAHHTAGHPFDRKHPLVARTWQGISRKKAKKGGPRKAKPIMGRDLRELIQGLDPAGSVIDARDAALLVLGWAAALRRSELRSSTAAWR
jgi:hypothetical protein